MEFVEWHLLVEITFTLTEKRQNDHVLRGNMIVVMLLDVNDIIQFC